MINNQEQSMTELLKAVREQSDQLNYQMVKIKSLEEKVVEYSFRQRNCPEIPHLISSTYQKEP